MRKIQPRSAISNTTIVGIVVIVLIIAGVAGYFAISTSGTKSTTSTTTTTTTPIATTTTTSTTTTTTTGPPITVVWSGEFTGAYSTYGAESWLGASIVINQTNAAGGIDGRLLHVIKMDDQTSATQALTNIRQADTQDNALVFTGSFDSDIGVAIKPYAETNHFPVVIFSALDSIVSNGTKWVVSVNTETAAEGASDAEFVLGIAPTAKIALVVQNTAFTKGLASAFKWYDINQTAHTSNIVYDQIFPVSQSDFTSAIAAIKASGANFIMDFVDVGSGGGELPRELVAAGFSSSQILLPTESAGTIGSAGSACVGCYMASFAFSASMVTANNTVAQNFVSLVNASIPNNPSIEKVPVYGEYLGYQDMKVIVAAIHKVLDAGQTLTRTSFNNAVHSVSVPDLFGRVESFTPNGASVGLGMVYVQVTSANPPVWTVKFLRYITAPPNSVDQGVWIVTNVPP